MNQSTKLTDAQTQTLTQDGFVILRNVLPEKILTLVRKQIESLWVDEGSSAGVENYQEAHTRRLANLADKGVLFRALMSQPLIMNAVAEVIGKDMRVVMLNARDALPMRTDNKKQPYVYHVDVLSNETVKFNSFVECTVIWMLDPFSIKNGATRIIPGSHKWDKMPGEILDTRYCEMPDELHATGSAGDVLIMNGHCWHAGGRNNTIYPRRALLGHYLRADQPFAPKTQILTDATRNALKPQEAMLLDYPQHWLEGGSIRQRISNGEPLTIA